MPEINAKDEALLDRWVEAKRSRDFKTSDRIRDQLEAKGIKPEEVRPLRARRATPHSRRARHAGACTAPQVRPHVWEAPGSRRQGVHGQGAPAHAQMGRDRERGAPPLYPPGIDPKVGDWHCSACGNWNWQRRRECNQCSAAKEGLVSVKGAASGTKRLGEGGGFKEFDAEEDARRKARAQEKTRETEQRKAEKKKCQFCSPRSAEIPPRVQAAVEARADLPVRAQVSASPAYVDAPTSTC